MADIDNELGLVHDAPVNSMQEAAPAAAHEVPPPARSESTFGMRRGASKKKLDNGDVVELVEVGRFCRFVAARPVITMILLFAFIVLFVGVLGIPGYFAFFDGGMARRSLESRTSDSFLKVQEMCLEQMDERGDAGVLVERVEAFSQEQFLESLRFFFKSKSGNMLSQTNIDSYVKVLDATMAVIGGFCVKAAGGSCSPPHAITTSASQTTEAGIKAFLNGAKTNPKQKKTSQMFVGSDVDYDAGTTTWLQARVKVGGPLPSYDNLTHNEEDQLEEYGEEYKRPGSFGSPTADGWIVQVQDIISAAESENSDLQIYFVGGNNLLPRMFQGLMFDVGLALFAIALVGAFMWLQIGSGMLCLCGMFQILASFVLTLSTWKLFGNGSFTFMHGLVIYIILGVGADDIFVFTDAWKQSRSQASSISGSVGTRLQWSLSRAAKAMLVTSITTCSAFLLTAMTDLPIIATFGSFASLVIIWNFLLVVSWYPACVVAHELYVVRPRQGQCAARFCGCACVACAEQWGLKAASIPSCCGGVKTNATVPSEETPTTDQLAVVSVRTEQGGDGGHGSEGMRGIERLFHDSLYGFLANKRNRIVVLVVFGILFVAGIVCAATGVRLTDRAVTETYLIDGHPLQVTLNLLVGTEDAFAPQDDSRKHAGYFVFGVDPSDPIDRSGTDPLSEGEDLEKVGEPVLLDVDLSTPDAQLAMVTACHEMSLLSSVHRGDDGSSPEVHCFMTDFRNYRLSQGLPFPVPAGELVGALWSWREDAMCAGQNCYRTRNNTGVADGRSSDTWYDDHTNFYAEGTRLRAAYISGNLSIPRMEQELDIITPEYHEWRDAARDTQLGAGEEGQVEVMGLTGRLEWIAVMHALVQGVQSGVPSSLVIALAVLVVSTANWLVALLATATILGVMSTFFITFVASGWVLGMYECMFLQLTAGMAVDYTVHLAHAYNESAGATKEIKLREALTEMGVSVLSGAVSTLGASVCLFVCSFKVFYLYGSFIFFVILWAILWALLFFPAIMLTVGPAGEAGDIKIFRAIQTLLSGAAPAQVEPDSQEPVPNKPAAEEEAKEGVLQS